MIRRARPTKGQPDATKPTTTRCAVYTRKSTEEGLDQEFNSLDAQREAAEAYIASQKHEGWVCRPDTYDDGGFTGGNMDRPALKRLIADVEAGRVDCVIVYKVDRLSRSLLDFARIMEVLDKHRVSFVSVTQQFNTSTSTGLMQNVLLSFAQFEREIIAERTRDKMSAARRKGKWIGGVPVLGYDVDPQGGRIVVNEAEAKRVRAVFDLYLEKESLTETLREVNRRRWTTKAWVTKKGKARGGTPFEKNTLFHLLTSTTYVGKVAHRGTVYPGEHEGTVDEVVWGRVQRLLRRNGKAGGRVVRNKSGALLRGLLYCAPCDAAMVHSYVQKKNGSRYRYYVCSTAQKRGWSSCPTKSLPAGEIEKFVVDRVRAIGTDASLQAEVLRQARAGVQERADSLASERRSQEGELRRHAAEVKRLVRSTQRASATTARLAELQELTSVAEQRLAEVHAQQAALDRDQIDEADLATALAAFDPIWDSLSPREQARVVHLLVERVAYDATQKTVAVTFRPGGIKVLAQEVG